MNSPPSGYKLFHLNHLPPANTGTDITHPVVITNIRMLIIVSIITSLCSIIESRFSLLLSTASQCTPSRSSNHLITVERQACKLTKRATFPALVLRSQRLCSILQYRNTILISDCHNLIHPSRHAIQMHRNNSLRFLARQFNPILNCYTEKIRRHIPCFYLTINKHRRSPQIPDRICRSRKSKALTDHLIPRAHTQLKQPKVNSRSPRA